MQACLLEYGYTFKRSKTGADGDRGEKKTGASGRLAGFDKEFAKMQKLAEREEEERAKAFEAREKQLMGDMQKIETSKVDVGGLAGIIGLESEEIREGAAARDEMVASIQQNENGGKKDPEVSRYRLWLFGCLVVWLFGCLVVWLLFVPCKRSPNHTPFWST